MESIRRAIQTEIGANVILSLCYPDKPDVAPLYCERVKRDPETHQIVDILSIAGNIGGIRTDGIDLAVRYALPTPAGRFTLGFEGVWLHKYDFDLPDGTVVHARGNYDGAQTFIGGVYPAFKFDAGLRGAKGGFVVAINTQFIGSFHECGTSTGVFGWGLGTLCSSDPTFQRTVSPWNSWDLFASYAFETPLGKTTCAAGVNNVFDRSPPLIFSSITPTSDPMSYDFVGRFVYGRVVQRF